MSSTIYATFWDHVDKSAGPDACWPWQRSRSDDGYGVLAVPGRRYNGLAHRTAYELAVGRIPAGYVVRHACDNPPCCNPRHLSVGTYKDNRDDMVARGRQGDTRPHNPARGEDNSKAKLTADDVRLIRATPGSSREVSAAFNVTSRTIRDIRAGHTWRHIEGVSS